MRFGYELIVILLMLVLNAIFAAYEMALASVSRSRLAVLVNSKKKGAEAAAFMKDRMEASLAVVQLGITMVGAIAAATGGAGVEEAFVPYLKDVLGISEPISKVIAIASLVIPLGFFTIIFSELVPKMFALNNREWVCLRLSGTMKALAQIAYPVVSVFENVVKALIKLGARRWQPPKGIEEHQTIHELRAAAALARTSRLIGAREEKIVMSAAHLSVRSISNIMLPAADISMIPIESSLSDALVRSHLDMHTRFPVCEKDGDPQTIKGYVNVKDIINALKLNPENPSISGITRPLKIVNANMLISEVLEQMILEKVHIALIASDSGSVVGMVTLEDIIEELVGEIEDEFDRLPPHIHPYGSIWIMGGGALMGNVALTVGIEIPQNEKNLTLADWCTKVLGRQPEGGEVIESGELRVTVRKLRRRKLSEAVVGKLI
ncbi:MAG: hemolysin family protein [Candidatus Omnitrophica bacterium]|nr:hemolysin family protein [Candidatus Omnitrophota bacterium]